MPAPPRFEVFALSPAHERASFYSGTQALDRYFHNQVTQDAKRRIASCFVACLSQVAGDLQEVAGYYTLSSSSAPLTGISPALQKKLPRYPSVPVVRMGRLAVSRAHQGLGLGAALLADALARVLSSEIAAYALVVDAKDAQAAAFYAKHGFLALQDAPLCLYLPLATAQTLLPS